MNYGFTHRLGSQDNTIGRPPQFYTKEGLINSRFCSLYAVREEDARLIEAAGTVAGFKGIVWSERLWVDFDDNQLAIEAAVQYLKKENLDYVIYDTGNRGVHIGIRRDANPSHLLPQRDRSWASANLPGCDLSLYWHLHMFRMPGTVHEKTGREKSLIGRFGERPLILPEFNGPAKESIPGVNMLPQREMRKGSIFTEWSVASNLIPSGHRRQLVELAAALKNDAKVTFEEALWVVGEVNRGFEAPKEAGEVERIVRHYYDIT